MTAPTVLNIGTLPEWNRAEVLLLNPTAVNMETIAGLLGTVLNRAHWAIRLGVAVGVDKSDLTRLRVMADRALQLRLNLARIAAAGQANYTAAGDGPETLSVSGRTDQVVFSV